MRAIFINLWIDEVSGGGEGTVHLLSIAATTGRRKYNDEKREEKIDGIKTQVRRWAITKVKRSHAERILNKL